MYEVTEFTQDQIHAPAHQWNFVDKLYSKGDGNDVPKSDVSTNNLFLNAHSPVITKLDRPDSSTNPHPDRSRIRAGLARGSESDLLPISSKLLSHLDIAGGFPFSGMQCRYAATISVIQSARYILVPA
jgi:hypothetical protein